MLELKDILGRLVKIRSAGILCPVLFTSGEEIKICVINIIFCVIYITWQLPSHELTQMNSNKRKILKSVVNHYFKPSY